ncbi:MAG: ABC transporter permease DevC [Kovacikia sp.]
MKPPSLQELIHHVMQELPLSIAQLSHQKVRLAVALAGISFANILIFMQLGFRSILFDGTTRLQNHLYGDLYLFSSRSKNLGYQAFSRRHLYQAGAVAGVASVVPLYYAKSNWKNPETKELDHIYVLGFNPAHPVLALPEVNQHLESLKFPDTVLFDQRSQKSFGPIAEWFGEGKTVKVEMNDRRVTVANIFSLGGSLFKTGHVVTSDWNYMRLFGPHSLEEVHLGIINLKPGGDALTIQRNIQAVMPPEVKVLTHQELIAWEEAYWSQDPAGVVFNFGTIMGFIVGVVIVYQVLYSDVNDHLAEYATLKAIGYSDVNLLLVIFQEAMILAILGFIPGYSLSVGMYALISSLTRVPIPMRIDIALQVFILTLIMCLISGAIASRKLQSADPADIF